MRTLTCMVLGLALLGPGLVRAEDAARVSINTFKFLPPDITVKAGQSVEWVNDEKRTPHSVVIQGQPESDRLFPGDAFRHQFSAVGTYPYYCGPHPEMKGRVIVVP